MNYFLPISGLCLLLRASEVILRLLIEVHQTGIDASAVLNSKMLGGGGRGEGGGARQAIFPLLPIFKYFLRVKGVFKIGY